MKKKLLALISIIVLLGICIGVYVVYEWNKPHPKAKNGIPVTAQNLAKEYNGDEKASDAKYLDRTLEVSGTIDEVSKNQDSEIVVTFDTGDPMSEIQCTMLDKNAAISKGQKVTIIGFCRGNNMGVILTDCIIK